MYRTAQLFGGRGWDKTNQDGAFGKEPMVFAACASKEIHGRQANEARAKDGEETAGKKPTSDHSLSHGEPPGSKWVPGPADPERLAPLAEPGAPVRRY